MFFLNKNNNQTYKYLWIISSFYVFIILISDMYESKLVNLFFLKTGSGILLFSFTFFIIGIITYVYGIENAKKVIRTGLFYCISFILISSIILLIGVRNEKLVLVITATRRIFISTVITSLIAEYLNAHIVNFIKNKLYGQYIGITLIFSIFISSGVSMFIFCSIAFYTRMQSNTDFLILAVSSWFYRFITELLLVGLSKKIIKLLIKHENLEGKINELYTRN